VFGCYSFGIAVRSSLSGPTRVKCASFLFSGQVVLPRLLCKVLLRIALPLPSVSPCSRSDYPVKLLSAPLPTAFLPSPRDLHDHVLFSDSMFALVPFLAPSTVLVDFRLFVKPTSKLLYYSFPLSPFRPRPVSCVATCGCSSVFSEWLFFCLRFLPSKSELP
jgi:hypothetical protein